MKVYTKKGDKGTTQLIGGTRVPKSSLRIEAYGTVDELNSYIGLIRDQEIEESTKKQLIEIQDRLFTLGSLLAQDPEKKSMNLPKIYTSNIEDLEKWIDEMDKQLEPMRAFVLPGGHTTVSHCHVARCICRRAERATVDLDQNAPVDSILLKYLNRLSDYLFVLGRKFSADLNAEEIAWVPRMEE